MSEENPEHLDQDRWWIDRKLDDINRFEQRQLQIIGLMAIIITLFAVQLPFDELTAPLNFSVVFKNLLRLSIFLVAIFLIGIYFFHDLVAFTVHPAALVSVVHIETKEKIRHRKLVITSFNDMLRNTSLII